MEITRCIYTKVQLVPFKTPNGYVLFPIISYVDQDGNDASDELREYFINRNNNQ